MKKGIAFAILAAALYAINAPFSKILLDCIPPTLMAGFLYVGAGIGMIIIALVRKIRKTETNEYRCRYGISERSFERFSGRVLYQER